MISEMKNEKCKKCGKATFKGRDFVGTMGNETYWIWRCSECGYRNRISWQEN